MTALCSHCHEPRPLAELLRVVPRRAPWRARLVCRPTVARYCFAESVGSAALERIEPARAERIRASNRSGDTPGPSHTGGTDEES